MIPAPRSGESGGPMLLGVGVDVVSLQRFSRSLFRTPGLLRRILTENELAEQGRLVGVPRLRVAGVPRESEPELPPDHLDAHAPGEVAAAAAFSVKEAVMKSLGIGLAKASLSDIDTAAAGSDPDEVALSGRARQRAESLDVTRINTTVEIVGRFVLAEAYAWTAQASA